MAHAPVLAAQARISAAQLPVSAAAQAPLSAQAAALLLSAFSIAARALLGSFHLLLSAFLLHVASVAASAASLCISPLSPLFHVANANAASPSDSCNGSPHDPLLSADAAAAGGPNEETQKDNERSCNAIGQQYPSLLLYGGHVAHHRSHPTRHGFNYAVRYALVNLDAPPDWFARSSAEHHMSADEARSFAGTDGPILLLTNPTSMGYEQNPISVYYCYRGCGSTTTGTVTVTTNGISKSEEGQCEEESLLPPADSLAVCIGEVSNTPWTDRVTFLFAPLLDHVPKPLHVSPFMDMQSTWVMRALPPSHRISLHITALHPVLGCREAAAAQESHKENEKEAETGGAGSGGEDAAETNGSGSSRNISISNGGNSMGSSIFVACLDIDCLPAAQQPYLLPPSLPTVPTLPRPLTPSQCHPPPRSSAQQPSVHGVIAEWSREVRCRWWLCCMPHRVAFWIYWQAFLLWWKGVPLFEHPKYTEGPAYAESTLHRLSKVAYIGKPESSACPAMNGDANHGTPGSSMQCPFKWRNASTWPWN